jgi:hypothetical protein
MQHPFNHSSKKKKQAQNAIQTLNPTPRSRDTHFIAHSICYSQAIIHINVCTA